MSERLKIQLLKKRALALWTKDQASARSLGTALIAVRENMPHGAFIKWFTAHHLEKNRVYYCIRRAENKVGDVGANFGDGRHYWLTPPELYRELNEEFHFDCDPCPYPCPPGFDGLTAEWGTINYVNPPFIWQEQDANRKKHGITAWVRKAIEQQNKGKTSVIVLPQHGWVLMLLQAMGTGVRNLGNVRWRAIEDGVPMRHGCTSPIGMFILRGKATSENPQGQ